MATALEQLRSVLDAIPADEVQPPDMPVDVYFQETDDLQEHLTVNALAQVLEDEGLDRSTLDALPLALAAAREAQTAWTLTNERAKPDDQRDAEKRGYELRTKVSRKARFALRANRAARSVLSQILEGDGVADLVQDLDDLRMLLSHHATAFARNKNFDATAVSVELSTLAAEIRKGLSGFRMNPEQAKAVDLRNRAWTHLDQLVDDVREAGRAATDGKLAQGFASAYLRRKRQGAKRKGAITPTEG